MADPVNMSIHGGMSYNANDAIPEYGTKVGREGLASRDENKFILRFKSGETVEYSQQPTRYEYFDASGNKIPEDEVAGLPQEVLNAQPGSNLWGGITKKEVIPTITKRTEDGLRYDDNYFNISNAMGATFTTSKKTVAHVTLDNCQDTTVDLAANDSAWYGDEAEVKGGANNEVVLDAEDKACINGKEIKGKGTAAQKDY